MHSTLNDFICGDHHVRACRRCQSVVFNGNQKLPPRFQGFTVARDQRCRGVPQAVRGIFLGSGLSTRFVGRAVVVSLGRRSIHVSLKRCTRRLHQFSRRIASVDG